MVIDVPEGTTWLKGNIEVNGYYIVNYDNTTWREIIQQLKTNSTVSNYRVYQYHTLLPIGILRGIIATN